MVALLFISNLNIIFSKDIDKNNSINYQCLWVVRDALKSEKSIDELINFASEKQINDAMRLEGPHAGYAEYIFYR